ncbi:hypothetical protein [Niallia sp. NCCP-28]|uniref:hypothetical protein n=1 Tax=Niallia sp. NCCP-28 TaxID=2934712 RepID=UPI00208185FD|nr:hypothetical protein [Niallia sp. NCCP-28]GKU82984.1 hypothetical protein NCCP28_23800 [Niallia sp. NCCP-28]
MREEVICIAASISTVIFIGLAMFQILLALEFPLGKATMGGFHKVLPKKLRFASGVSAIILLFMGLVLLQQSDFFSIGLSETLANTLTWIFAIYLAINTIVNLLSKSKIEKSIMTPISGISFILCLFVAFF